MAGTIRPNEINVSTTPILSSKTLPGLDTLLKSDKKPSAPRAPRVDIEPLYTAVKSALSDVDWTTYKNALSSFLLGNLNQDELSQRLDRILSAPALEHAHNVLIMGVIANVWRDAPEAGVASWVSSSDKVSSGVAKGTGDEGEKRLKHEVMQMSRRERKRLKTIHQGSDHGGLDGVGRLMLEYHEARRAKLPEPVPVNSAGQHGKTNWDLEIRKRYTSSLFTETYEFPTATTISHRLLPICYEHALYSGHSPDVAEYMNTATEIYIKEALTNFFQLVNSNGPGYLRTADFKKRVEREEEKVARGELQRVGAGELPIEAEERRKRKLLCMEDLRLALEIGDQYLPQIPILRGQIINSTYLDTPGMEELHSSTLNKAQHNGIGVNGPSINGTVNGSWNVESGDPMIIDEELTWQGGSVKDMDDLDGALDGLLELGNL